MIWALRLAGFVICIMSSEQLTKVIGDGHRSEGAHI
jgi:hypothetical protein